MAAPRVELADRLEPRTAQHVLHLAEAAAAADGTAPLSEHVLLHLRHGADPRARNLLAWQDGELAGYAHLDVTDAVAGPSAELAVHPRFRRRGVGGALLDALLAESPHLRLWAHGEHSWAAALATGRGLSQARVLHRMRRELHDVPEPRLPDGVRVRSFEVGRDEQAWLRVNARAFAGHPEQGRWGLTELQIREQEPWFDPAGFFLAEDVGNGRRLLGFHWTKVHGDEHETGQSSSAARHEPLGEVYVLGLDPSAQGRGLAPALTLVGLHHLRAKGLPSAMLYVEADNVAAIRLYSRLGFVSYDKDVLFRS